MGKVGRVCVLAALLGGLLPAAAMAQTGSRQSAELRFVEQLPGVPSALTLGIDYVNPNDPTAKPPAVRTVVEELAAGAQIDTSIPERCTANDAQLMAQGADACPRGSRVGIGSIRIDTGFPEPGRFIDADVVFLNNSNQLIFVSNERGSGARVVTRSEVRGRQVINSAPTLPGTPPDGGAIDLVQVKLNEITREIGGAPRGYVTTPGECPGSGAWSNSVAFTYADGVSQTVSTDSPCARGGEKSGRCANPWNGSPSGDRHTGTPQGDLIFGFRGKDRLLGRRGADCLHGGRGADLLLGGPGPDRLFGGRGRDVCRGGRGRDRLKGCETIRSR
jgi:RTX calcium-binding nonapeptide repeat (4 copies)